MLITVLGVSYSRVLSSSAPGIEQFHQPLDVNADNLCTTTLTSSNDGMGRAYDYCMQPHCCDKTCTSAPPGKDGTRLAGV